MSSGFNLHGPIRWIPTSRLGLLPGRSFTNIVKGYEDADKDVAQKPRHGHQNKHRRHEKKAAALNLGNLSRASGQRTGDDMVQTWLAQSTFATQNYPTVTVSENHQVGPSHTHRYYDLHGQRHSRSLPRDARRPTLTRPQVPPQTYEHPPNSRKRALSDSSILSGGSNPRLSPKHRHNASRHESALHGLDPAELSGKLEVSVEGSGPDEPASPMQSYRPKKPRHKTRVDKYEHKKDRHRSRKSAEDEPPPKSSRRRKEDKKKAMATSKNVMSNWVSKAVLNDRITPIRPGIFKNGREANTKPVDDLVFSDMHFLQDQKCSTKPKPLSERRLRELEKQQREMKEVSSFFLPAEAVGETLDAVAGDKRGREQEAPRKLLERSVVEPRQHTASKSSESEPRHSQDSFLAEQVLPQHRDLDLSRHDVEGARRYQDHHNRPISSRSSRPTTYFSWSTSPPRSPLQSSGSVSQDSSGLQTRQTTTPETIRRALVDSGIFRGTGIAAYDQELMSSSSKAISDEDQCGSEGHGGEGMPPEKTLKDTRPQQTDVDSISARGLVEKRQKLSSKDRGLRENIANFADIGVLDKQRNAHSLSHIGGYANNQAACLVGSDNDDGISITSKDLMPPPPLPNSISQPRMSGAMQNASSNGPNPRYYPTSKELSAAARVVAQHDTTNRNIESRPLNLVGNESSTEGSSHHGIASLEFTSWVTPSPKPPTPSLTTNMAKPDVSSTSSYNIGYTANKEPFQAVTQAKARPQESIADFIARIEREAEILPPTPMSRNYKACEVVSPLIDSRFVNRDEEIDTAEFGDVFDGDVGSLSKPPLHENQPPRLPSNRAPSGNYNAKPITRGLEEKMGLADHECPRSEYISPGSIEDVAHPPESHDQGAPGDNKAHGLSTFWGPNNFIQF
ncbi:uncharacterized protein PG998_002167 [Apiospora kogelbergensis]|uniref:uncharacterized protein n=1 Tax=Apiospora kogelbergensis TaxID=1337665 RepID=UPI003131C00F